MRFTAVSDLRFDYFRVLLPPVRKLAKNDDIRSVAGGDMCLTVRDKSPARAAITINDAFY